MSEKPPILNTNQPPLPQEEETIVTPEQQEQIKKIEQAPISLNDKVSLVLLILNKRKVSGVSVFSKFEIERDADLFIEEHREEARLLVDLCRSLGLEVNVEDIHKQTADSVFAGWDILVAKSKSLIERYQKASKEENHAEFGELSGYPETAVAWFSSADKETLLSYWPEEAQRAVDEEGLVRFKDFRFSPNWAQELNKIRHLRDLIKTYAPALFQELMSDELGGKH